MSRRYPLQPLLDAAGLSLSALRDRFPMSGPTYRNARQVGLTEQQADRYACGLGLVAVTVWPEMIDHAIEDASVECESCSCSVQFIPTRKGHRFCSTRCSYREKNRRLYERDEAHRERKKAESAAYRASAGRAIRIQQAAYRAANRALLAEKQWVRDEARRRAKNEDVSKNAQEGYYKIGEVTGPTLIQCPDTGLIYELRPDSPQGACDGLAA